MDFNNIDFENITLGEWLEFWFITYKKPYLKPYSLRNIEQVIRLHTPQWLKEKQLKKITVFDIDRVFSTMLPSRTLVYTKQVWNNAFFKACNLGLIDKNVISFTDKIKYKKQRGNALTINEQFDFLQRLEGQRIKWLMLFYLYTGTRRNEALTLKWSDINETEQLILIRGTKTEGSFRYILLTDDVKYILVEQRKQVEQEQRKRYQSKNPDLVFDYSPETVSRHFKNLCPTHHLHDLRHTYITRCCESGMNVTVCQQLVGHSTPQLTLGIYTHVMDDFKRSEGLKFSINPRFVNPS